MREQYCTVYKILDTFHDCIYRDRGTDREFIFSNNPCFGEDPLEQLSNFLFWCRTHQADMKDIQCVEWSGNGQD